MEDVTKNAVDAFLEFAPEVALDGILYFVDNVYDVKDIDVSAFAPIVTEDERVEHETITSDEWTIEETIAVRDALALSQIGYVGFSDLVDECVGADDASGYLIDEDALYANHDWNDGIVTWTQDCFDIARVQEVTLDFVREANFTLVQGNETLEYYITIGGTDSLEDVVTNAALAVFGTTFSK